MATMKQNGTNVAMDFLATQGGQYISVRQRPGALPVPEGPVVTVTPPPSSVPYSQEDLS
jgi:hypothetical protein